MQPLPEAPHTLLITVLAALVLPAALPALLASAIPVPARAADVLSLATAPAVFIVLGIARRRDLGARLDLCDAGGATKAVLTGLAVGAAAFVCYAAVDALSVRALSWWLGSERVSAIAALEQGRTLELLSGPPWRLAFVGIVVVLAAPFGEEAFFRGYVYAALRHHMAPGPAVAASAALFAAFHMYVVHFPAVFAAGLLFAWAYERTGSILVPAMAHATVNAAVAGVLLGLY